MGNRFDTIGRDCLVAAAEVGCDDIIGVVTLQGPVDQDRSGSDARSTRVATKLGPEVRRDEATSTPAIMG